MKLTTAMTCLSKVYQGISRSRDYHDVLSAPSALHFATIHGVSLSSVWEPSWIIFCPPLFHCSASSLTAPWTYSMTEGLYMTVSSNTLFGHCVTSYISLAEVSVVICGWVWCWLSAISHITQCRVHQPQDHPRSLPTGPNQLTFRDFNNPTSRILFTSH